MTKDKLTNSKIKKFKSELKEYFEQSRKPEKEIEENLKKIDG